jgi:hypothetical protein
MIGLDTSHVPAFTDCINNPENPQHVPGGKVVAAVKGGSLDITSSRDRVEGYTKQVGLGRGRGTWWCGGRWGGGSCSPLLPVGLTLWRAAPRTQLVDDYGVTLYESVAEMCETGRERFRSSGCSPQPPGRLLNPFHMSRIEY